MENNLTKRRRQLGLSIDELAHQEKRLVESINVLEKNGGVYKDKARVMSMMIQLGVPYSLNERGSLYVENLVMLQKPKEVKGSVVYEDSYFKGSVLGNGLLQDSTGTIRYNELRDAIAQSTLSIEDFAKHYNLSLDTVVDIAMGRHLPKDDADVRAMLDALHIRYTHNDIGALYITRNFKVVDDDELATYLEQSLYLDRKKVLRLSSTDDDAVLVNEKRIEKPHKATPWTPAKEDFDVDSLPDVPILTDPKKESLLLASVKVDMKTLLVDHQWSKEDSNVLKEAFKIIAVKQLDLELASL